MNFVSSLIVLLIPLEGIHSLVLTKTRCSSRNMLPSSRIKSKNTFHAQKQQIYNDLYSLTNTNRPTNTHLYSLIGGIGSISVKSIPVPLIGKDDVWGNIATICATASISHKIGKTTAIGRLLGPPVTAMAIAFCLGSIGFLNPGRKQ